MSNEWADKFDTHASGCAVCSEDGIAMCEHGQKLFEAWSSELYAEVRRASGAPQSYYRPQKLARPAKKRKVAA